MQSQHKIGLIALLVISILSAYLLKSPMRKGWNCDIYSTSIYMGRATTSHVTTTLHDLTKLEMNEIVKQRNSMTDTSNNNYSIIITMSCR